MHFSSKFSVFLLLFSFKRLLDLDNKKRKKLNPIRFKKQREREREKNKNEKLNRKLKNNNLVWFLSYLPWYFCYKEQRKVPCWKVRTEKKWKVWTQKKGFRFNIVLLLHRYKRELFVVFLLILMFYFVWMCVCCKGGLRDLFIIGEIESQLPKWKCCWQIKNKQKKKSQFNNRKSGVMVEWWRWKLNKKKIKSKSVRFEKGIEKFSFLRLLLLAFVSFFLIIHLLAKVSIYKRQKKYNCVYVFSRQNTKCLRYRININPCVCV